MRIRPGSSAAVDGVHVVDKGFHSLVYAADGLVDCMLDGTVLTLKAGKVALDVIVYLDGLERAVVSIHEGADFVDLFLEGLAYERSKLEVEGRNGLASVHLVLDGLHGDAGEHTGGFYPLCGTGFPVAGPESVLKDDVQGMLDAGEGLCRIVVLVVNMNIVVGYRVAHVIGKQAFINITLCGL